MLLRSAPRLAPDQPCLSFYQPILFDTKQLLSESIEVEKSPYTPGAGHRPPVLAGRDDVLQAWRIGLNDVSATGRRRAPDMILTAPRGAGKTVTVSAFRDLAEEQGFETVRLQVAAGNSSLVGSLLRRAAARAEDGSGPWQRAKRAFERLGGVSLGAAGFTAGITLADRADPAGATARTPEDLAEALLALDREVRIDRPSGGVLITVDEIQSATAADLSLLAAALGSLNDEHPEAHVMFAATGLPNSFQAFVQAEVTHADRLFQFTPISLVLAPADATFAIVEPARQRGVAWEPEAAELIVGLTSGYPAHLQVLADQTWMSTPEGTLITRADAESGSRRAAEVLERLSMGPRFDALTDREREFLTALAVNGGRAGTATLAQTLGRNRTSISDLRDGLIAAGDVYMPRRGELALAAPLFGRYLLLSYAEARELENPDLLTLDQMRTNLATAGSRPAGATRLKPGGALDLPRPRRGPDTGAGPANRRER